MSNIIRDDEIEPTTLAQFILRPVFRLFAAMGTWFDELRQARKSEYEYKKKRRDELLERQRNWRQFFVEKIFMILDYDPTDAESGEVENPNLLSAVRQWLIHTFWSRRIELGGTLMLLIIGVLCYYAILASV